MSKPTVVNFGVDTLLVNLKLAGDDGKPNGDTLPEYVADALDLWQAAARKEHKAMPTDLTYHGQTLFIRPHGSGVWSWLLSTDDLKLSLSYGSLNGGVFCQARLSSHLLWSSGPESALIDLQAMLYEFVGGHMLHVQASEIHVCADLQGWDIACLNWLEGFVSRVVRMRERPELPTQEEQEGGLTPTDVRKLEGAFTTAQPMVTTSHRRLATLDFGSHGSEIMAQMYNKSAEIKKSGKSWFLPIWTAHGWDGTSEVWRVEFRFRRKALASFDLNEAYSVLARLDLLWQYATLNWLRYVDLTSCQDSNKSRLPADAAWQIVQSAFHLLGTDEEQVPLDTEGEQRVRLDALLQEKPLTVLEHAVGLSTQDTSSVLALQHTFSDSPIEVVQEMAHEVLAALAPEQVHSLVSFLSPQPFQEVQATLIKRARRMARRKMCVSALAGYASSLAALAGDAVAQHPDLMASLIYSFGQVSQYNHARGRVHLEEVWKKRLAYGFITAVELNEQRAYYGVDLLEEDWLELLSQLERLQQKPKDVWLHPENGSSVA